MSSVAELMNQVKTANALGVENLRKNKVLLPESATTYEIMQSIADISLDGVKYENIICNEDGTVTLIDTNGTTHTMEYTCEDEKIISVTYDGEKISLSYDGDTLIGVDGTAVDIANIKNISNDFYDTFWDNYQENGSKIDYSYAFNGRGWNNENFKPKYDIVPTRSNTGMFSDFGFSGSLIELFERQGLVLDTTQSTGFQNMFLSATAITDIPELVIYSGGKAVSMAGAFGTCLKLQKVSLDIRSSVSSWVNTFATCPELQELNIKGVIDINGFDVHWSTKLNKESIKNIVNTLSSTADGLTVTLSLSAINKAFETSEGANDGSTSEEWLNLAATKSNWTVSLL